jgi:uncharacterized membrane protein
VALEVPAADNPSPAPTLPREEEADRSDGPPAVPAADEAAAGPRKDSRPDWVVLLVAVAVFIPYTFISVLRYVQLATTSWDLGIFTEYVKQYADLKAPIVDIRGAGFDLLGDHFHPIVALIAPFFRLFPTPVTLLVAQTLMVAVSVVPVYQAGAELLGKTAGRLICVAYGFSWGLQELVTYDFHELAFAVPLLAFSLSALVRGRFRAAVLWALPLVFVKEDQGFTLAVIGLVMVFSYRRRGLGLFLAGWGLLWSLLAIYVIIPHFSPTHSYLYWSQGGTFKHDLAADVSGLVGQLFTASYTKLPTVVLILLVGGFLAVRSPLVLALLPSLLLRFLSTNFEYWSTQWHYNAPLMPIVFIAAIDGMARIRAAREAGRPSRLGAAMERHGAAIMLTACIALVFQFPLSTLWLPATYVVSPNLGAEKAAIALVPDGVTVETDSSMLAPLAARTDTFDLTNWQTNPVTQYVVYDVSTTDFPAQADPMRFLQHITHHARYRVIFDKDGVYVLRLARHRRAG